MPSRLIEMIREIDFVAESNVDLCEVVGRAVKETKEQWLGLKFLLEYAAPEEKIELEYAFAKAIKQVVQSLLIYGDQRMRHFRPVDHEATYLLLEVQTEQGSSGGRAVIRLHLGGSEIGRRDGPPERQGSWLTERNPLFWRDLEAANVEHVFNDLKEVADIHGGKQRIRSSDQREGSVIELEIPISGGKPRIRMSAEKFRSELGGPGAPVLMNVYRVPSADSGNRTELARGLGHAMNSYIGDSQLVLDMLREAVSDDEFIRVLHSRRAALRRLEALYKCLIDVSSKPPPYSVTEILQGSYKAAKHDNLPECPVFSGNGDLVEWVPVGDGPLGRVHLALALLEIFTNGNKVRPAPKQWDIDICRSEHSDDEAGINVVIRHDGAPLDAADYAHVSSTMKPNSSGDKRGAYYVHRLAKNAGCLVRYTDPKEFSDGVEICVEMQCAIPIE